MMFITIESIIWFCIGFFCGYISQKEKIDTYTKTTYDEFVRRARELGRPPIQPGIIHRPSANQLKLRSEPTIVREEKQAIRESLDQIPELQEHRRLLQEQERS